MRVIQLIKALQIALEDAEDENSTFRYLFSDHENIDTCDPRIMGDELLAFMKMRDQSVKIYKVKLQVEEVNVQPLSNSHTDSTGG